MATKSVLKNIDIRDKHLGRSFVDALEHAEKKTSKDVRLSKTVDRITKNKIVDFFGD